MSIAPRRTVAQVGWTGSDEDRDRFLIARLWLSRNDPGFAPAGWEADAIDLNAEVPRDFLAERRRYDVVITHNLWGGAGPDERTGGAARSPRHGPAAWVERLEASGPRYVFLFGPDFNVASFDRVPPGYESYSVTVLSFLDVLVRRPAALNPDKATRPIHDADVNAARLAALLELRDNRALDLSYTRPTAADLRLLADMPNLRDLRLLAAGLTDADLEAVAAAVGLEGLSLDENPLSGTGLRSLAGLPRLRTLSLDGTKLADDALRHLAGTGLELLSLIDTPVGDAALDQLGEMPRLRSLFLNGTRVTPEGVARFRGRTPGCEVHGP